MPPISALAFAPDGIHLYAGSDDGTLRVYDTSKKVADSRPIIMSGFPGMIRSIAISADERNVALCSSDGFTYTFPVGEPRQARKFANGKEAGNVVPFGESAFLVANGVDGLLTFDPRTKKKSAPRAPDGVCSLAISPAGPSVGSQWLVSGGPAGIVQLWLLEGKKLTEVTKHRGHQGTVIAVAIGQDGRYIYSGGEDGTVRVWATPTLEEMRSVQP